MNCNLLTEIVSERDSADVLAEKIAYVLDTAFGEETEPEKFEETARKIQTVFKSDLENEP